MAIVESDVRAAADRVFDVLCRPNHAVSIEFDPMSLTWFIGHSGRKTAEVHYPIPAARPGTWEIVEILRAIHWGAAPRSLMEPDR